jgi:hypothetical protein
MSSTGTEVSTQRRGGRVRKTLARDCLNGVYGNPPYFRIRVVYEDFEGWNGAKRFRSQMCKVNDNTSSHWVLVRYSGNQGRSRRFADFSENPVGVPSGSEHLALHEETTQRGKSRAGLWAQEYQSLTSGPSSQEALAMKHSWTQPRAFRAKLTRNRSEESTLKWPVAGNPFKEKRHGVRSDLTYGLANNLLLLFGYDFVGAVGIDKTVNPLTQKLALVGRLAARPEGNKEDRSQAEYNGEQNNSSPARHEPILPQRFFWRNAIP